VTQTDRDKLLQNVRSIRKLGCLAGSVGEDMQSLAALLLDQQDQIDAIRKTTPDIPAASTEA
jgi:hypothetical protein